MNEYLELFHLNYFLDRKKENRYWWFRKNEFFPPVYSALEEQQFILLMKWFRETDEKGVAGECSIPLISTLLGFISGSGLDSIVQLGHAAGYSSLLIGWMLQKMGKKNALFSIDINPNITAFAQRYIDQAGLDDVVALRVGNSIEPKMIDLATEYFGNRPKVIFIDSSHQYKHTLNELHMWWSAIPRNGIIFLHDVSVFAASFDKTNQGGVTRALSEFLESVGKTAESISINAITMGNEYDVPLVILDGCGFGMIFKL